MDAEPTVVGISLKKVIREFGSRMVQLMDHSGIPLYLILHPEEIEILSGSRPVGLEVNLPAGLDAYMAGDDFNRGRRRKRTGLVFRKKNGDCFVIEVVDRKIVTKRDRQKSVEKARRFNEILGVKTGFRVLPLIVHPLDSAFQLPT